MRWADGDIASASGIESGVKVHFAGNLQALFAKYKKAPLKGAFFMLQNFMVSKGAYPLLIFISPLSI